MRTIDEFGVVVPLRRILDRVAAAKGFLHVSLDVDFLDPAIAPGVGTPVPGGTTFREAHLIMEMLYDSGLAGSLDVVELNPFFDERGKSALVLSGLVASLFGRRIFGHPVNR
jgi:arginase